MKVHEEAYRGMGDMCCGPRRRRSHAGFRLTIGLLLTLAGLIWLGVRMGWVDSGLFQAVPLGPAVVIMIGVWMTYRGLIMTKKIAGSENHKEG